MSKGKIMTAERERLCILPRLATRFIKHYLRRLPAIPISGHRTEINGV